MKTETFVEESCRPEFGPFEWESYPDDASSLRRDAKPRRIVTAPLAGAAYVKARKSNRSLTHAVELGDDGAPLRVLCGKVKLESILDDATQYDTHPLDCNACIRKFGDDSQADEEQVKP
jgi:hypothetical protein